MESFIVNSTIFAKLQAIGEASKDKNNDKFISNLKYIENLLMLSIKKGRIKSEGG